MTTDPLSQIVEACRERLQAAIDATEHATSRMLVRFAAELANASVLRPESLLELFGAFADCAARVVESDGPKQQGNFFAALALEALLWGGKTLAAKSKQALDALLAKLQDYMESDARPADFDLVRSFAKADRKVNEGGEEQAADIFDACDFTEALFRVVQRQTAEDWRCDAIQKPYLSFQGKLAGATAHPMAVVTVPELFDPAAFPLRMVFRVLDPDIDDMRPADRLVCETHIIDAIELYNFDHEERDETTGAMICKVQESAWRLTGGIQRRRIVPTLPAKLTREQSDKIICETIFSQMFQLPQSPQPLLYYSLLLNHLCKLDRHRAGDFNEFSTMLVFTIECIFEQIVEVDVQCLDIFAEWFAHHLSNCITPWKWEVFDGKASTEVWDWHKWDEVANMPAADPRRLFVTNLLERCVRLAYRERILRVLPEQLHPLLPAPVPEETPFKYEEGSAELAAAEFAPELRKKMVGKVPPNEVIAWLDADILPKLDGDSGKEVVMDVAVHVCLCHGNDPTHLQHMIAKNLPVLQHLGVTDRAYTPRLLKAVTEFWACSSQHLIMTVVRLLSMRIVASPAALINFVFDEANLPALEKPTWWEVLRITLAKTVARSQQVEDDLAAARAELAAAPIEVGSSGAVRMQGDEDEDEDSAIAASLEEDTVCPLPRTAHRNEVASNMTWMQDRADADEMRTDAGAHGRVSETKRLQEKVGRVEAALETVLAEQKEMLLILYQVRRPTAGVPCRVNARQPTPDRPRAPA
jgi:nuclear cap-binding protein subunit 1